MAKKSKSHGRWRVIDQGHPGETPRYVYAPNEKSALDAAAEEYKIAPARRNRLVATPG